MRLDHEKRATGDNDNTTVNIVQSLAFVRMNEQQLKT